MLGNPRLSTFLANTLIAICILTHSKMLSDEFHSWTDTEMDCCKDY